MEIVLLRHGKPDFHVQGRFGASDIPTLLQRYNQAAVSEAPTLQVGDIGSSAYTMRTPTRRLMDEVSH